MRKVVSNMKLQKLEYYQPSDLVKLLNESGATTIFIALPPKYEFYFLWWLYYYFIKYGIF